MKVSLYFEDFYFSRPNPLNSRLRFLPRNSVRRENPCPDVTPFRIGGQCTTVFISCDHLNLDRPLFLLPVLGSQTVVARANHSWSILATCPPHCHLTWYAAVAESSNPPPLLPPPPPLPFPLPPLLLLLLSSSFLIWSVL